MSGGGYAVGTGDFVDQATQMQLGHSAVAADNRFDDLLMALRCSHASTRCGSLPGAYWLKHSWVSTSMNSSRRGCLPAAQFPSGCWAGPPMHGRIGRLRGAALREVVRRQRFDAGRQRRDSELFEGEPHREQLATLHADVLEVAPGGIGNQRALGAVTNNPPPGPRRTRARPRAPGSATPRAPRPTPTSNRAINSASDPIRCPSRQPSRRMSCSIWRAICAPKVPRLVSCADSATTCAITTPPREPFLADLCLVLVEVRRIAQPTAGATVAVQPSDGRRDGRPRDPARPR